VHEFAIAQSLLEVAAGELRRVGAERAAALRLRVGSWSGVDEQLLSEAFALLAEGTPCADARLVFEQVRPQAACRACGGRFEVVHWNWRCPPCGGEGQLTRSGDELELVAIEAEGPQ